MNRYRTCVGLSVALLLCAASWAQNEQNREEPGVGPDPRVSQGPIAPVLEGIGDQHMRITTTSDSAQQFFDQGLSLLYAFNHDEAVRAFREALRHDPDCAMAHWGWAFAVGPNINRPMQAGDVAPAHEHITAALALTKEVQPKEAALINALAPRYSEDPDADRAALDLQYAQAARALHEQFPEDNHIATLYAASLMNLNPWGYWTKDGRPRQNTERILDVLEAAIARDPMHTGALHYYIHATEEHYPEKSEYASDQLAKTAPNAGHLVHMPSHIYMRLGRYEDAYEANRLAVLADEGYITACRNQGIYPLAYYPHNIHFMCWAAQREGRKAEAIAAGRKVGNKALQARDMGADFALHQAFLAMPYYALARFGEWDAILKEPAPPKDALFTRAAYHYVRGLAYVFTDRVREAKAELETLNTIRGKEDVAQEFVGFAAATTLLDMASYVLQGEIDSARDNHDAAIASLERAARLEDSLTYNEPPDWPIPVRHNLGAVLLNAERFVEAESVYWTDLKKNPDNPYALFGLVQALRAQGNDAMADEVQAKFDAAWVKADTTLSSSRY